MTRKKERTPVRVPEAGAPYSPDAAKITVDPETGEVTEGTYFPMREAFFAGLGKDPHAESGDNAPEANATPDIKTGPINPHEERERLRAALRRAYEERVQSEAKEVVSGEFQLEEKAGEKKEDKGEVPLLKERVFVKEPSERENGKSRSLTQKEMPMKEIEDGSSVESASQASEEQTQRDRARYWKARRELKRLYEEEGKEGIEEKAKPPEVPSPDRPRDPFEGTGYGSVDYPPLDPFEDDRDFVARVKDFFFGAASNLTGFFREKAKRENLSTVPGQAEEKGRQRKNLVFVVLALALTSVAIVYVGSRTHPAKKPTVHVYRNDFRLGPDTLEKESFERQYEERLDSMGSKVETLEKTLSVLNERLKREQERKRLTSPVSAPPVSPESTASTEAILKAASTPPEKAKPRLGHLRVGAASDAGKGTRHSTLPLFTDTRPQVVLDEPIARNRARGESSYLPAGSFARALVLSGVTAPTGATASVNAVPMLLEVTDMARLPNDFRSRIDRCFITANATGDLSSERVWIRLDRLSCMTHRGEAIDVQVRGYVTGEDGKTGVRARVVTRSGQAIANALLLGTISGLGKAVSLSATETTTYTSGSMGTRVTSPWKAGLGKGIESATDRIVDYFIKLADKIFPVLELDSGREVDVVLSQGVTVAVGEGVSGGVDVNSSRAFGESVKRRREAINGAGNSFGREGR